MTFPQVAKELAFPHKVRQGMKDLPGENAVRRVQEWLTLRGFSVAVDGIFGPATAFALEAFERSSLRTSPKGYVDAKLFHVLAEPLREAVPKLPLPYATRHAPRHAPREFLPHLARMHLAQHPREVGGPNAGPWVRVYMDGNEGPAWHWCAGFVTFLAAQYEKALGQPAPYPRTYSCDRLAEVAQQTRRFVSGAEALAGDLRVLPSSLFLVRKSPGDWTHTGIVTYVNHDAQCFMTIEGNTNDEGHRDGYEVCQRTRALSERIDFFVLPEDA